jgi:protein-tyrosine phosphatase
MTYVVAFFSKFRGNDQDIFEMQQSMLWNALEGLDKYTDDFQDADRLSHIITDEIQGRKLIVFS